MEPERAQALRDTKALYDEGVLDETEYKAKKKELLAPVRQDVDRFIPTRSGVKVSCPVCREPAKVALG